MYESITYEELKSLPRDQKAEALKELKALYPTQKKIAEKLGVNPANIYNMIAKYAKAEDEGQLKAGAKAAREASAEAEIRAGAEGDTKFGAEADLRASLSEPTKTRVKRVREKKMKMEENLLITLSKSLTGEEAQALLNGIGSIFLKNHDYRLEIRISEK